MRIKLIQLRVSLTFAIFVLCRGITKRLMSFIIKLSRHFWKNLEKMPRTKRQCMKCHSLIFVFGVLGLGRAFFVLGFWVLAFCHWRFVLRSLSSSYLYIDKHFHIGSMTFHSRRLSINWNCNTQPILANFYIILFFIELTLDPTGPQWHCSSPAHFQLNS